MARNLEVFIKQNFKKAIEKREIQVFYQPVIRTFSRKLCSFEALARWIDPERGMIFPDKFIPILEKERMIHQLDVAVLRQVCEKIRNRIADGETPIPVSVNLSRLDFILCDIFSVADQIVSEYQIPHEYIYFEITESVIAENPELFESIVDRFRSAGYQVWMDDFGSAYSSLNVLKELSFDEIKLDMQFLRPFNLRAKRIATAIVEMAKHIDIHTLVEGVETEEQYSYLRNIGCEKVQGYYFGRPMPYEEALARMQEKGIGIEVPQDRQYYDDIGRLDVLSAVPFMTREEHDTGVIARQLNSIPLALAEFEADGFRILFYNSAFEEAAAGAEMLDLVLTQEMLGQPQPYYRLSDKVLNLMDSVKEGGEGRLLFTSNEEYFEVKVRNIAKTRDRYCVIIRLTNLTKDSQSEYLGYLDEFLRRIYDVYERITLVDFREDSIRPLYTSTQEDLVSGRRNISKLAAEFAEKYVFPDDREKYIRLFDRKTTISRLAESGDVSYNTELIRGSIRHGRYAWMEYTLLRIDKDKYYLLVRNVQGGVNSFIRSNAAPSGEGGLYSPSHLWNNLLRSGLLRLFWKDEQRRFVGASQAFLDYYGFPSIKVIAGKNDEEVGWHVHPEAYMNDEYQVIHEGATLRFMPGLCINDGENKEILASKTPLYDDSGEIRGLLGFFIDRDMLNANDRRGTDTARRDALTGLLNSRGIAEEAAVFRDEYFLRGVDFIRIHIMINDFNAYNEQYGFDFGDKILSAFAHALKEGFGLTCAVGRYAGLEFVVLRQVKSGEEIQNLRAKIKAIGDSVSKVDGVPVTLYLSAGYTLFSECPDLEDQARNSELRLHADHDHSISAKSSLAHASEIFRLFDKLPLAYCVCHVSVAGTAEDGDTIICYVNRKFEEITGTTAQMLFGRKVREIYPEADEAWFTNIKRAALDDESVEGILANKPGGKAYRYMACQIICHGYCVVMYQETE